MRDRPFPIGPSSAKSKRRPGWKSSAKAAGAAWAATLPTSSRRPGCGALAAKHCLAVANGTSALLLRWRRWVSAPVTKSSCRLCLSRRSMPFPAPRAAVFVDTDPEPSRSTPGRSRPRSPRGPAVSSPCIWAAPPPIWTRSPRSRPAQIPVLEDACQAHLAEWRGRKVSTLGEIGCFSFQGSKNLNAGEGGAILTNSDGLFEQCKSFQNNGRGLRPRAFRTSGMRRISDHRVSGCLVVAADHAARRAIPPPRAKRGLLDGVPQRGEGDRPARIYEGCTRNAYHLYMFRYNRAQFEGLPRAKFLDALMPRGSASGGYQPLDKEPFLKNTLQSRGFQAIYGRERISEYLEKRTVPPMTSSARSPSG